MNMSSCSYLDPASLLAQSAVSIRLGRRASSCSHTLLATARRAPLNESSVQGSLKQPSTAASAPTQVLQSVGIDHLGGHNIDSVDAGVDRLLAPRHGEPRRRAPSALPGRQGALQVAVNTAAEQVAEELTPPPLSDEAEQPPPELLRGCDGQSEAFSPLQRGPSWDPEPYTPLSSSSSSGKPTPQLAGDATELGLPHGFNHLPHDQRQRLQQQQQQLRHRAVPPVGHGASRPLAVDWGSAGRPLLPAAAAASAAAATAVALVDTESADSGPTWTNHSHGHGRQPPAPGEPPGSPGGIPPPRQPPGEPPAWPDGPIGGQWGGLESELRACRSVHSVQRFLQLMGPRVDSELMGSAIVHLSHLVSEEPPDGDVERQLLAGLLDQLTQRLRGGVGELGWGLAAATVCAMSRLRCYDGPLLREVAAAAREAAAELTARQTAGLVWAFGRYHRDFGFRLEPGWSAALLQAVVPRLQQQQQQQATPQDVAMMLYGAALLREPPPPPALDALLAASLGGMSVAGGRELSMTIWALATLRLHPGREWLLAFLDRCDAATRSFASGVAVCNVLYGLAAMRVQPPAPWMLNFLWQAQRRMNTMDAQSLVMLGWALGRMRYRPDRKWLTRFFRYSQSTVLLQPRDPHLVLGASTQQLARQPPSPAVLQAASQRQLELWRRQQQRLQQRLQQRRPGPWVDGGAGGAAAARPAAPPPLAAAAGGRGSDAVAEALALPPQAYNVLLWACVRLSCRPMGRWLPLLCAAVQPRLASWPPHELSALLWGLARLSCRPRDDWMTEYCAAARLSLARFQPPDCVMTLLALSRLCSGLGYRVSDGELANALAARLAPYYPRLQTTTLISVLLAISRITPRVRPARLEEALAVLLDRVQVVGVAMDTVGAAADAAAPPPPPPEAAAAAHPGRLVAQRPPSPPPAAAAALPQLTARECVNAVFAIGCVALWPGYNDALRGLCGALLRELLPRAIRLAPALNGIDLVLLLHGVAMSRSRVGPVWLRRHEEQALRLLRAGELRPAQLRELHRAYHALDYPPELLPPPGSVSTGLGHERGDAVGGGGGGGFAAAAGDGMGEDLGSGDEDGGGVGRGFGDGMGGEDGAAWGGHAVVDRLDGGSVDANGGEEGGVRSSELSEAARARRRQAAQGRRRRVTAAVERRVAEARRPAAEQQQQQEQQQTGEAGAAVSNELEEAERALRDRRATIRRYTAVARRAARAAAGTTPSPDDGTSDR
ncbi:hypothetical protein PLESTB_000682200 [Pleodorina starrii]|uniref:Uncharacterized protein n=1 Tax=Pleodorina starrii TaxID=330485 RepID=A0A9W6BJ00_9CHLO|nr:hypothetical protein PLESTM_001235000 [Pleodorina starrii]GLC52863.1 hypothetical protein PLESTB_000682200 [Pleodorina starrii]